MTQQVLTHTDLRNQFSETRKRTESLCADLAHEDFSCQPIPDVSPPKWHLAHSTWFFEQFVLTGFDANYKVFNDDYAYLFNSYYNHAGTRVNRHDRGMMTRPTVAEVMKYRSYVTEHVEHLITNQSNNSRLKEIVEIGINHEQQHQELLVYDIKYILGSQPTYPKFKPVITPANIEQSQKFIRIEEGVYDIGYKGNGFCFDNEIPRHKVYNTASDISSRLVSNREYLDFVNAGGYENFDLWHAEGWDFINSQEITAPLYWEILNGEWHSYDFQGLQRLKLDAPVMHISYFEAFAYAEWKNMRLPTEFEWEIAAPNLNWGQLWEWTASAYLPYPGFQKAPGALGEYNGKFMVNQHVLRGASVATASGHKRATYRNFFAPACRWMYSGLRLAKKLEQ